MKTYCKVSEAEWVVMTEIWRKAPIPAGEIVELVGKKSEWTSRTIRTLLARLVKKGAVGIQKEKPFLYWPRLTMEQCLQQESRSFVRRLFGGEPAAMLLHMAKETALTKKQIQELRKILSEKEK
jgi:BlaI family penicillinase repressor